MILAVTRPLMCGLETPAIGVAPLVIAANRYRMDLLVLSWF